MPVLLPLAWPASGLVGGFAICLTMEDIALDYHPAEHRRMEEASAQPAEMVRPNAAAHHPPPFEPAPPPPMYTRDQVNAAALQHDARNTRYFMLVALKRRLLKGVRTGKRTASSSGKVEWPVPSEQVGRAAFPFLPARFVNRPRTAVRLIGEQALDILNGVLGAEWDYAERRTGEIFMVATIVHDDDPPRQFTVEVGMEQRRTRWYQRVDGSDVARYQVERAHWVLYMKFTIYHFHKNVPQDTVHAQL
jgi:hypothetical protein